MVITANITNTAAADMKLKVTISLTSLSSINTILPLGKNKVNGYPKSIYFCLLNNPADPN